MLPTNHGFDEFYGNLYHLNAEEEPEMDNYPSKRISQISKNVRSRGVIHSWATEKDDKTEMPRWGKVGKQKIEDTGPLNKKRMETCDDEFVAAAEKIHQQQNRRWQTFFRVAQHYPYAFVYAYKEKKPWPSWRWQSPYHDTMIDHDKHVGQMLDFLMNWALQKIHLSCIQRIMVHTETPGLMEA